MAGSVGNRVALLTVTQAIEMALGLVTGIIVARILGPAGKGLVALAYTLPVMISSLGNLGIGEAAVYFSKSEDETARGLPILLLFFSLAAGLIYAAAVMVAWPIIGATAWKGLTYPMAVVSILLVPIEMLRLNLGGFIFGRGRIRIYCAAIIADAVVTLGMTIYLIAAGYGVWGAIVAQVAGELTPGLVYLVAAWTLPDLRPRLIPHLGTARSVLGYGFRQWTGTLATSVNLRLDYFLVNWLLGPSAVGIYSISTRVAEIVLAAPDALRKVWFARVAAEHHEIAPTPATAEAPAPSSQAGFARTKRLAGQVTKMVAWMVPLYAVLASVGIVVLYGPRYIPSIPPFLALLPGVCALAIAAPFSGSLAGTNRPGAVSRAAWVAVIATVVLDLTLIPLINVMGAAVASSVAYSVFLLAVWLQWRRHDVAPMAEVTL